MKKQLFRVQLVVETEVESSGKPYLNKGRVRRQIEKFLSKHHITDGLACHGTGVFRVVDVTEEKST